MNATKKGLYDVREDFLTLEEGSEDAARSGVTIISQCADLALVCSHALDSVLSDSCNDVELDAIASASSHISYQIWNDIQTVLCSVDFVGGGLDDEADD